MKKDAHHEPVHHTGTCCKRTKESLSFDFYLLHRMFQSSICRSLPPKVLQLAEDLELTCDVRLAAGKGLGHRCAVVRFSPQNEAAAMASNTADQWQAWQFQAEVVRGELEVP